MSVVEALEELKSSTDFLDYLARLNQDAEDERRRRECFVEELDEDAKAEFINGQVVVHSPARRGHLRASFFATNLLGNFVEQHELGEIYTEKCLVHCQRNDYGPDICFFTKTRSADWYDDTLIFPPPDLIVEILSPSTERNDRTVKLKDYARHDVAEYWIVDADARSVEQYLLPSGASEYRLKACLSGMETLASVVLADFTAPVAAFFDAKENQSALRALADQFERLSR